MAHPDLVPVVRSPFAALLGDEPHQKHHRLKNLRINDQHLLDPFIPSADITEAGLRLNVSVGILYIESWLRGVGAAAINNLMEDAATASNGRVHRHGLVQNHSWRGTGGYPATHGQRAV